MQMEHRSGRSVSETIVRTVAAETGREPLEMRPFGASIDTDALDALFDGSSGESPTVTVEYEGCRVTVDGEVVSAEAL